jgi:hypothetical protein
MFSLIPGEENIGRWLNKRVRMRGVCWTGLDAEGRVFGFEMHVPGTNFILPPLTGAPPTKAVFQPGITAESLSEALALFQNLGDPPHSPANVTNKLPVLTNIQQVLDLGLESVRLRPHPVRIIGVVTYAGPEPRGVYLDDGTGGIHVSYSFTDSLPNRHVGQVVWVDGIAGAGPVRPWIAEARLKPLWHCATAAAAASRGG